MSTPAEIQDAARKFRFAKFEGLSEPDKEFISAHLDEVANALPPIIGRDLYEAFDRETPAGYVGTPDPDSNYAMREKILYTQRTHQSP